VISGIVHVLKSGGRWVDAPSEYDPRKTLYNRFVGWAEKGVWTDLFHALAQAGGPPAQVLIDSSAVKAHRSAAGGKGGNTYVLFRSARSAYGHTTRAESMLPRRLAFLQKGCDQQGCDHHVDEQHADR
jgi:transposase